MRKNHIRIKPLKGLPFVVYSNLAELKSSIAHVKVLPNCIQFKFGSYAREYLNTRNQNTECWSEFQPFPRIRLSHKKNNRITFRLKQNNNWIFSVFECQFSSGAHTHGIIWHFACLHLLLFCCWCHRAWERIKKLFQRVHFPP